MKRSLAILLAYVVVSAGLIGGLLSGVLWLVQPGPTVAQEPRAAPIPPRIAESIERKLAPPPAPVAVKEPEPVKPAMQEAQVSLTSATPRVQIRDLAPPPPVKRKPRRDERTIASQRASAPQEASSASARVVSTGRSDSPY